MYWVVILVVLVAIIVDCWMLRWIKSSHVGILIQLVASLCWTRLRGYLCRLLITELLTFSDWIVIVSLGAIVVSWRNLIYA